MNFYLNKEVNKHPLIKDDYDYGRDILTPEEVENIDYIYHQIVYRHKLLLDANAEHFQIWRRKRTGEICDDPICKAQQHDRRNPLENCPTCGGTGFKDGYDYIGEILVRVAPTGEELNFSIGGKIHLYKPRTWTLFEPRLLPNDILFAIDQERFTSTNLKTDIEVYIDITENPDFSKIDSTNVTRILKISDKRNSEADYTENIDYKLSNDGILWISSNRPTPFENYYVTYEETLTYIKMFETTGVTLSTWRGKPLSQNLDIEELNQGHHLYDFLQVNESYYDFSRFYNAFPYSEWYERD